MSKLLSRIAAALLMSSAMAGCANLDRIENLGEKPKLDPVGNPAGRELTANIPVPPPISHADNSLWQPGAHSFFHDPRASHIGDVITVNVTVADAAKLSNSTARSRANSEDSNLTNFFGLETVLPAGMDPSSLVKMGSDTSNVGAGTVNRSESINLTLAALIAQVLPNGNMVIDGHQQVRVNGEMRDLQVSGIVRTEDITSANTIDLSQIAEARISYGGKGTVSDVQQPRYGSEFLDSILPW
ncbi:MAG TPA: flagellar basal body L-ring protein FlgH [Rhizomicrobium sp.]|jgi:flagellar L-ring protein precursor FlgH|nr:flagellar basal body L-ring protein FlgH [Rhizomicrobium sp.]